MIVLHKQVVVGVLASLAVAYIYAIIIVVCTGEKPSAEALGFWPLWMVAAASWFVVPTGIVLGICVRLCSTRRSKVAATIAGAGMGVLAGLVLATFSAIWEQWPALLDEGVFVPDQQIWWHFFWGRWCWFAVTITPICAVWVGVWSWFQSNSQKGP